MRCAKLLLLGSVCSLAFASLLSAKTPLGEALKDIDVADHWIYDDLPKAVAEAKSTGKPLMVVIRCVPCPPGRSLDQQVMMPDAALEKIEKQFVCVRIIQTNSLDLSQFQYDFDMSWSGVFMNADGTIYGRYGTRNASGPGSDSLLRVSAFSKAAERALELHKAYPANREQLAAKRGKAGQYRTPRDIPGLKDRPAVATERQQCIHCHMVKEYAIRAKWEAGKLSEQDLYLYPMPQQIGLAIDDNDGLLVKSVAAGSAAAKAGIQAGDALVSLGGQPLVSIADVQWVLNASPEDTELPVSFRRKGQTMEQNIVLAGDWKKSDIGWRASSWYGLRQGVKFEPLSAEEKRKRGLEADSLALAVKGLFGKGGPKFRQAGIQQNDVIVAVDGKSEAMSESDFLVGLRLSKGPKDRVTFTVLRGGNRREITMPMW